MKRFASATALFVALSGLSLHAQTLDLRASIPFNFHMGNTVMPAGDYQIYHSGGVIRVREANGAASGALSITLATSRRGKAPQGSLEFNRYDDTYFLTKVWVSNSTSGLALPKTTREKELISRGTSVQTAGVMTRKR
jgi:hypothetical protein